MTMVRKARHRWVSASAPSRKCRSVQITWKLPPDARTTLSTSTLDLFVADLGKGIIAAGIVVEGGMTLVGHELVGLEPVVPHHGAVRREGAHIPDEFGEITGNDTVGGMVVGSCRTNRHDLAELIDLYHPRDYRAPN